MHAVPSKERVKRRFLHICVPYTGIKKAPALPALYESVLLNMLFYLP